MRAWHAHEDPRVISEAFLLTPSYSYKAGEPRTTTSGKPLGSVHRETLWSRSVEIDKNTSLVDAIALTENLVARREQEWDQLRLRGWRLECFVGVFLDGNRTEVLSSQQMLYLATRGIDLVLNLYPPNHRTLE